MGEAPYNMDVSEPWKNFQLKSKLIDKIFTAVLTVKMDNFTTNLKKYAELLRKLWTSGHRIPY